MAGLADEGVVVRTSRVGEDAAEEVAIGRGLQHAAQVRAAGHAVARERVALVAAKRRSPLRSTMRCSSRRWRRWPGRSRPR